ncbi:hypothetical protein AMK26_12930 [Streptomyces sp. CB03234]|uniref:hypothetical protein n=1 Tax=Streptomyces sp. (strain CB03234) TaxID=1703937 RepID=UPI00093F72F5|nr:hypothetical protein [Streptomyces sp. CB03234]OKK06862.1 hypothetical protein AMK26_12930 [Streptomyces sp. CB03234]
MLTYKEVTTTNFGHLTTTADKWDESAREFKKAETAYGERVQKITLGPDMSGLYVIAAHTNFTATRYEYAAAQTQAQAIAKLLRDAHEQFTELKGRLNNVVQAAREDDMLIDENGKATRDPKTITRGEQNELSHLPEAQAAKRQREENWTKRIQDVVKAFDDADQGVKLALEAVVVDSNKDAFGKGNDETLNGFNAGAKGDIEAYEAINATDIATRINNGEKVSAAEYAEFNRAFRDNNKDKTFTHTFLSGMGAEGTLKLANRIDSLAYVKDKENKGTYESIKGGIANSIATAATDPKFQAKWRADMRSIGVKDFEGPTGPGTPAKGSDGKVLGYQVLMGLMERGDTGKYAPDFVKGLAQDIYAAEKGSKGNIWDINQAYNEKNSPWFVNDPLDSALGLLSKHPDASTDFLTPGTDPKNSALNYLLRERDWNGIVPEHSEWGANTETSRITYGAPTEDGDARVGFAAALEAATTGHQPGAPVGAPGPHSEMQASIMHETIKLLDQDSKGDSIPEGLKVPLGRAMTDYSEDLFSILSGQPSHSPGGLPTIERDGDQSRIANGEQSLIRVMRGVSDGVLGKTSDGDPILVFDALYEAEKRIAAEHLASARNAPEHQVNNVVGDWNTKSREVASVMGTLTGIGSDMTLDVRDAQVGKINDDARYSYHVVGGVFNTIPVVGDAAQRMVDAVTYEWSKDVIAEKNDIARAKDSSDSASGLTGTNMLLQGWAEQRGVENSEAFKNARGEADQSYKSGREDAYTALRTRS